MDAARRHPRSAPGVSSPCGRRLHHLHLHPPRRLHLLLLPLLLLLIAAVTAALGAQAELPARLHSYRSRVKAMFYHAYDNYMHNAMPFDELRPLTCDGQDTWGRFSLTLIDALDTLLVLGNTTEFQRVSLFLEDAINFNQDVNVSVFETNIRVVGGLLSAHLLSKQAGVELEDGWPCSGPLLRMAEQVARKLLPAFQTATGMPYGTVNLRHGVHPTETSVTCTAGVGTFILEFSALSRLTGDPVFEDTARTALLSLWTTRSDIGLVGNHIDVKTSAWVAQDAGIGAGIDSYFEYLVKGAILLHEPEYMEMFKEYSEAIEKYMKHDDWYVWVHMSKGTVSMPVFQSLDAYWPGLQSLVGNIDSAMKTLHNYHQVWRQFGGLPEFYNIPHSTTVDKREGYPLRPELVESAMYLYRATKDPFLLDLGQDILEAIEKNARVECGYATVKNVQDQRLENRMESFFLAETTKYLYLLFDPDNFLHNSGEVSDSVSTPFGECILGAGGYIFNTEAHPIDPAALYCCSHFKDETLTLKRLFEEAVNAAPKDNAGGYTPSDWSQVDKDEHNGSVWTNSSRPQEAGAKRKSGHRRTTAIMGSPSQPYTAKLSVLGQMFVDKE
ncbi:LOW QUALITY PROTEIN: ER degradation-enhancing alpha-mannosidase-like protein 2 [Lethenteron reissneri]|uniref:LOW QUALITY PROTEIN: ER degradation-enhancing alpha-mannosidase-like protein 2 n=1 Tax=Lethenteron reissneri TaxID=7753 RepID=UPI002AB6926B|nr:LOW QUALITY PROTEIN: ER degradation-enhancing alpha-mannosidase-like protein 2 [Lethenteron reissneri]